MKTSTNNQATLGSPSLSPVSDAGTDDTDEASAVLCQVRTDVLKVSTFERERLAHELHDDFAQNLAGIACLSEQLQDRLRVTAPHLLRLAEEITMELGQTLERIRARVHELAPQIQSGTDLGPPSNPGS